MPSRPCAKPPDPEDISLSPPIGDDGVLSVCQWRKPVVGPAEQMYYEIGDGVLPYDPGFQQIGGVWYTVGQWYAGECPASPDV